MRPLRVINVVLLGAVVTVAIVTYTMKHNAEVAADGIAKLQASMAAERDKIRTLTAEQAFLTQPSRLEAVITEHADYFNLQTFTPTQIASIDEIPMRGQAGAATAAGIADATTAANEAAVKATLARIAAGGALRER